MTMVVVVLFFLACKDFGRMIDHLLSACAFSLFFFEVEINLRTLIPLFLPGSVHSELRQLWLNVP